MGKALIIGVIVGVAVSLIVIIAGLVGGSYHKVEQNQICLSYDRYSKDVNSKEYTTGSYYLGLGKAFLCYPSNIQSIKLSSDSDADSNTLSIRTVDGINIDLDISYRYTLNPGEIYSLFKEVNMDYKAYLIRISRSSLRNTASGLFSPSFLTEQLANLSRILKDDLNARFALAHATITDLQLDKVSLPSSLQDVIRDIQQVQLNILTSQRDQEIYIQNEVAKNLTEYQSLVYNYEQQLTAARANLTSTIAARRGFIDAKNASSTQTLALEETNRQNILYAAQANNSQLLNLRVGVLTAAQTRRAQKIIEFQTAIDQATADATITLINANATAQEILTKGSAEASGIAAQFATERDSMLTLRTAGMNASQILKFKYLNALTHRSNATFYVDYQKTSLFLESGKEVTVSPIN